MDLAQADLWMLRKKFSVVVEKTARELANRPCLELDEPDPAARNLFNVHVGKAGEPAIGR